MDDLPTSSALVFRADFYTGFCCGKKAILLNSIHKWFNYVLGLKLNNENFILKILISLHAAELKIVATGTSSY